MSFFSDLQHQKLDGQLVPACPGFQSKNYSAQPVSGVSKHAQSGSTQEHRPEARRQTPGFQRFPDTPEQSERDDSWHYQEPAQGNGHHAVVRSGALKMSKIHNVFSCDAFGNESDPWH